MYREMSSNSRVNALDFMNKYRTGWGEFDWF